MQDYIDFYYASPECPKVTQFTNAIEADKIDKLEEEGGLCIMCTYFGWNFSVDGKLNPQFRKNMEYLAGKNAWFAPVNEILDYLQKQSG